MRRARRWLGPGLAAALAAVPLAAGAQSPGAARTCAIARDYWPTAGWRTASAASQGINGAALDSAFDLTARRHPNVYALIVVRHAYVVGERYFGAHDSLETFDLRSATKSVTSMLVGIAVARGKLRGVDEPISRVVPEAFLGDSVDPRKRAITLRHLLTMTSGIDWDERQAARYLGGARSWPLAILERPMAATPGRRFTYSSGNAHLLSVAVTRSTGERTLDFANEALFGPLGFHVPLADWPTDPEGVAAGGSALRLTAREMAKLGYLYLNDGCWDGVAVVPASWVRESTRAWSDPHGAGGAKDARYGFLWWLLPVDGHAAFMALGYGGQYIVVVPDLDLVIAVAADPAREGRQFDVVREIVGEADR